MRRYLPVILLILALPAGAVGYAIGVGLMSLVTLPASIQDLALLFVPLLIGGLCMLPFLIPFVDRKAKQDLAAYRASQAAEADPEAKARD
jgi:flagellar biosynthesis protein FliQ